MGKKRKIQESKDAVKYLLNPERMFEQTSIFKPEIGSKFEWSQETADKIKNSYKLWFDSWIKHHIDAITESQKEAIARRMKERSRNA